MLKRLLAENRSVLLATHTQKKRVIDFIIIFLPHIKWENVLKLAFELKNSIKCLSVWDEVSFIHHKKILKHLQVNVCDE